MHVTDRVKFVSESVCVA